MPEGDVVWRTARSLDRALAGRELVGVDFRVPALATVDLTGARVLQTVSRGKHLLTHLEHGGRWLTLHSHLRMEGSWHLYTPGDRWRRPLHQARVVLTVADRVVVGFALGALDLLPRSEEEQLVGHLGPDLLGSDWDAEEAVRRLRADPERPIGMALLDQRNLAGIGNIYRAEACFVSGVHPHLPVGAVPDLPRLVARARAMLEANKERPEQTTTGDLRRGRRLWVHGRAGQPCLRCDTPVVSGPDPQGSTPGPGGERTAYWCPSCQPTPD